jgi:hypothetical protein
VACHDVWSETNPEPYKVSYHCRDWKPHHVNSQRRTEGSLINLKKLDKNSLPTENTMYRGERASITHQWLSTRSTAKPKCWTMKAFLLTRCYPYKLLQISHFSNSEVQWTHQERKGEMGVSVRHPEKEHVRAWSRSKSVYVCGIRTDKQLILAIILPVHDMLHQYFISIFLVYK